MRKIALFIFSFLLLTSIPSLPSQKTGWIEKNSYYKPFVLVTSPRGKLVLFVTPEGKVYRGKCRKRYLNRKVCRVSPGKRFSSKEPLRYIVLQLTGSAPSFIETGVIR